MTRREAAGALAGGVRADLADCAAIRDLLEQQFDAALRHQSAQLAMLAGRLAPLLDAMEARRQQRVSLVRALGGQGASMASYVAALAEPARSALQREWQELEQLVLACKAATARNSSLLAEQFSIMQRVLHGEEDTYAPR
jgi:flagella synthesis protein FlgN